MDVDMIHWVVDAFYEAVSRNEVVVVVGETALLILSDAAHR